MPIKLKNLLIASVLTLCIAPSFANDSTATLGAGGLVLTQNDDIQMASEDLYISPNKVSVNYQFKNTSNQPITTLVAFPLPKLPHAEMNYDISRSQDPLNYINFKVWVNNKAITPKVQYRAYVEDKDITQLLVEHNVPFNVADPEFGKKIDALPLSTKLKLREAGALQFEDGYEQYPFTPWEFEVTYSWEQTFEANAMTQVRHEYTPIVGTSFFHRNRLGELKKNYCVDAATQSGFNRILSKQAKDPQNIMGYTREIDYILKTANNWKGPIGQFSLTVDKVSPKNIVSICEHGFKKISPTQFKLTRTNFEPQTDIKVLVVEPPQK